MSIAGCGNVSRPYKRPCWFTKLHLSRDSVPCLHLGQDIQVTLLDELSSRLNLTVSSSFGEVFNCDPCMYS